MHPPLYVSSCVANRKEPREEEGRGRKESKSLCPGLEILPETVVLHHFTDDHDDDDAHTVENTTQ